MPPSARPPLALLALATAVLSPEVCAQLPRPGSLLVFPEFDNAPGKQSWITVTNVDTGVTGAIDVRFFFVNGGPTNACTTTDFTRSLTPGDTLTLTSQMVPTPRGYVYAYAASPLTAAPVAHNHLTGVAVHQNALTCASHSTNAVTFGSPAAQGAPTDVDSDGVRDLNGVEYDRAPDAILVPRFFGQTLSASSQLVLINLTGGVQFECEVRLTGFNDNEEPFSVNHSFDCWTRLPLQAVSSLFSNEYLQTTGHSPAEFVGTWEQGWLAIDGVQASSINTTYFDPAVLAFLVDPPRRASAEVPFAVGTQGNGDLLPNSLFGDNN